MKQIFVWLLLTQVVQQYCFGQTTRFDSIAKRQISTRLELRNIQPNHFLIQQTGDAGNIGVFNGKQRLILIDNQWSVLAPKIKQQLKKITPRKPSLIINTDFHYEHTNGNLAFGSELIPIVAHENTRIRMEKDRLLSPPASLIQKAYPIKALPTITFIERMQLYDENEIIELTHVKKAHTDGDIIIQFKNANIFYTGDLFVRNGVPYIDENNGGDIYGVIIAVNYLINVANEESKIVPGHGNVCGLKELREYRDMLTAIRNKTIALAREKKTEEEIITSIEGLIKVNDSTANKKIFILHTLHMVQKHEKI
jgi:glyoxylase-like metal-dependent hydrolase (beta-lactamase superfamily II)